MTKNIIRRDHDDPLWSGRLVEGADRGWEYDECTFKHLGVHLNEARYAIRSLAEFEFYDQNYDGHGVIHVPRDDELDPTHLHTNLARLFELVGNLQRYLPWIEGWCVAHYHWIEGKKVGDVLSAHLTRSHAEAWLEKWNPEDTGKPSRLVAGPEGPRFGVEWMPAPILAFMDPDNAPDRELPR